MQARSGKREAGSGEQEAGSGKRILVRLLGLLFATAYAALVVWLYATQPQSVAQVTGGLAAQVNAYRIDDQAFADGLQFFQRDAFVEARAAFGRADPAQRDARTQFYIAYSFYRQGWGRVYNDNALFAQGLEAVDRAIGLAPDNRLIVNDENLALHSADELRAELQRGLTRDLSDLNPIKVFRARK